MKLKHVCDAKRFFVGWTLCRYWNEKLWSVLIVPNPWSTAAFKETTSLPRGCHHAANPGVWDGLRDPDKMVWCRTANPSVLTFNRMWAIQRELAVMNVLFGQNIRSAGPWGLCYWVRIKCNTVITEIILL